MGSQQVNLKVGHHIYLLFFSISLLLLPDLHSPCGSGSGSRTANSMQYHAVPDPARCLLFVKIKLPLISWLSPQIRMIGIEEATPRRKECQLYPTVTKPAVEPKYWLFKLPSLLPIVYTTHYEQSSPDTRHQTRLQFRVRHIHNFFIFYFSEANLSEYRSYSLHICLFRYILKQHLFASFPSYSRQNIRTHLHTNIQFDAKNSMLQQRVAANIKIFSYW